MVRIVAVRSEPRRWRQIQDPAHAPAGETAVITADLAPGEYGMICYLPDANGTAHAELGMVTQFTVA